MHQWRVQATTVPKVKVARGIAGTLFFADAELQATLRTPQSLLPSTTHTTHCAVIKANTKPAGQTKKATAKTAGKTLGPVDYLKRMKAAIVDLKVKHPGKDGKRDVHEAQQARVTEESQGHKQITRRASRHNRNKGTKAKAEVAKLEPAME